MRVRRTTHMDWHEYKKGNKKASQLTDPVIWPFSAGDEEHLASSARDGDSTAHDTRSRSLFGHSVRSIVVVVWMETWT